jgi:hypothetical protein
MAVLIGKNPFTEKMEERPLEKEGVYRFYHPEDPKIVYAVRPYFLKRVDTGEYIIHTGEKLRLYIEVKERCDRPQRFRGGGLDVMVIPEPVYS